MGGLLPSKDRHKTFVDFGLYQLIIYTTAGRRIQFTGEYNSLHKILA